MNDYRNTELELKYYGSDLNKFIFLYCSREMTCNNIDCVLYKASKKQLKFIEYKHLHEGAKSSQLSMRRQLVKLCMGYLGLDCGFFLVRANFLENGDLEEGTAKIVDLLHNKICDLERNDFTKWLNFEIDLA